MILEELLAVLLGLSAFQILWLLATRGRKAPLGYIHIQRDELGRWHWRWEKGG